MKINIFFHIVMLAILALAEGFRLTEFFKVQTGSYEAGAASAAVSVIVVLYLALFNMRNASIFATIVCVFLSLASFLQPYEDLQVSTIKKVNAEGEKILPLPQYNPQVCRGTGEGKAECLKNYDKNHDAQVLEIKKHNARVEKVLSVGESKTLRQSEIVVFILGALVLGFCVPILTYTVSHRLAGDWYKFKNGEEISGESGFDTDAIPSFLHKLKSENGAKEELKETEVSPIETQEIFEVPKDIPASVEKPLIKLFEPKRHPPRSPAPFQK